MNIKGPNIEDDRDKINKQRLKVNRVNLFQALNVNDEMLSELMSSTVIYYEEAVNIMAGSTREEKAKRLINCLINRNHVRKDWYKIFRNMLTKRNYNNLVIFLDNTIIKKPKFATQFQGRFSRAIHFTDNSIESQILNSDYNSNNTNTNTDTTNNNQIIFRTSLTATTTATTQSASSKNTNLTLINVNELTDRNFDNLLKKLPTYSHMPIYLLKELEQTKNPDDLRQAEIENQTFDSFKKLELLYSLYQSDKKSFKDTLFLDTNVAKTILNSSHPYSYMKYYRHLLDNFNIDLIKFITDNLVENFKFQKVIRLSFYSSLDDLVEKLFWIQIKNEKFEYANQLISEYLNYLDFLDAYLNKLNNENNLVNKVVDDKRSKNSVVSSKCLAYIYMVIVKNNLYNFKETLEMFDKAIEMMNKCVES